MRDEGATESETAFFEQVRMHVPAVQDWYHADPDGSLWMIVSYDDVVDGAMRATWRVDFDGAEIVAGRSPAFLNWDDGVRGRAAGMDLESPETLTAPVKSLAEAVAATVDWFRVVTQGRAVA